LKLQNDITISWKGTRGGTWHSLREIIALDFLFRDAPKLVILHLGGNDIKRFSTIKIEQKIRSEIEFIRDSFINAKILYINILKRGSDPYPFTRKTFEDKRKRLDRFVLNFLKKIGNYEILRLEGFDPYTENEFFRDDKIHLNFVGIEYYLYQIRECIIEIFKNKKC
jgi:lysophospholipase L1-like esterase